MSNPCRRCYGDGDLHEGEWPNGSCQCGTWAFPCLCPGFMPAADVFVQKTFPWIYRVLDQLFEHEHINGHGRREYLHRWVLLRFRNWRVYLHHFVASDWSVDPHDHPKPFRSIGLWGRYCDEDHRGVRRIYRAPWYRMFPAEYIHRVLIAPGETAWTLVLVGKDVRQWGFWVPEPDLDAVARGQKSAWSWVHWRKYVYDDSNDMKIAPAFIEFDQDER